MKAFARNSFRTLVAFLAAGTVSVAAQEVEGLTIGAAGWLQYNHIFNSSDNFGGSNLDNRGQQGAGAQITARRVFSEKLEGNFGMGVVYGHSVSPTITANGGYAPAAIFPYIAEANATYTPYRTEDSRYFVRAGFFPYNYNPDVKNLGLYLLRGPVYPGYIISGFETKHVLPVASQLGLQVGHVMGAFSQDLILNSETDFAPYFDLSLAYLANYQAGNAFRVGAGINFYHLIPVDGEITRGEVWGTGGGVVANQDTIGFAGIKLMANASFDPKAFLGDFGILGAEDLKLYGEIALIGLNNDSAHEAIYGGYAERMPVMVGFNLPTFRQLEHLSIEVQWYGSKIRDDLSTYNNGRGVSPSPLPSADPATGGPTNDTRDNIKWSLHAARMLGNRVKLSAQVANDHYRPGIYTGDGDGNPPSRRTVMTTPKDVYGSLKLAYFF